VLELALALEPELALEPGPEQEQVPGPEQVLALELEPHRQIPRSLKPLP